MKTTPYALLLLSTLTVVAPTFAEFEVSPGVKVAANKPLEAKQELPLNSQAQPVVSKSIIKASENRGKKDIYADKSKSFRCWQFGELIVAESGFSAPTAAGKALLTKSGKTLTGFDFGETFCIYIGS